MKSISSPTGPISGLLFEEPLVFERSSVGRTAASIPEDTFGEFRPKATLPEQYRRDDIEGFPELSEPELVRHYTRISQWNHSIDTGFYPLGSCTMKYNPKINERLALLDGFTELHPAMDTEDTQGALEVMKRLEEALCTITGLDHFTLQPCAGAQGEFTGLKIIAAYHASKGKARRTVLIPDSAHGTNPASCALADFDVVTLKTTGAGIVEIEDVRAALEAHDVAAMMITNPNTCGIFEKNIRSIADLLHAKDALLYMDGANYNAVMGITTAAKIGVDVLHINLHKTFSVPHGGGGPGAGPVGIVKKLYDFLPTPVIERSGNRLRMAHPSKSIGKVSSFMGNFLAHVRALAYILALGKLKNGSTGVQESSRLAILNANYIRKRLAEAYDTPFPGACMHECLLTDRLQRKYDVQTKDIAKRLMDYGFHPPTIYFPLVVEGAMLIEPTESESIETIESFCQAMISIANEAKTNPSLLKSAPTRTIRRRVDQLKAIKEPRLRWK